MEMNSQVKTQNDPYVSRFLTSPVYVMVLKKTIDTAESSYKIARVLSILLFSVGIILLAVAVAFGFLGNEQSLSLIFGGFGTANLIALLLYRPIERIQSGVDALIKSQIACLSFMAQYDSIARTLTTMPEITKEAQYETQLKLATYLKDAASQLIEDLNSVRHSTEKQPTTKS